MAFVRVDGETVSPMAGMGRMIADASREERSGRVPRARDDVACGER